MTQYGQGCARLQLSVRHGGRVAGVERSEPPA